METDSAEHEEASKKQSWDHFQQQSYNLIAKKGMHQSHALQHNDNACIERMAKANQDEAIDETQGASEPVSGSE